MPKQSTIDTAAAALTGFLQGRDAKKSRELEQEKWDFQRGAMERDEKRAESEESRRQREFTKRMLKLGFELTEAQTKQEKGEKYQSWLESMATDFGIDRNLITEEAVNMKMAVEQSRAAQSASRASEARSMAGIETERLNQSLLQGELDYQPTKHQLTTFEALQELGVRPPMTRLMQASGEPFLQEIPGGARTGGDKAQTYYNTKLDNLRQTMDRAVDLANKQGGRVPALNQVAEASVNNYFAMDYILNGGAPADYQPIQGMDFSEKFNLDDYMKVYKDLNPTGFAGMEQTRPGFEEQSEALRNLIQLGVGDMLGRAPGVGPGALAQDPNAPLPDPALGQIMSGLPPDGAIAFQEFVAEFKTKNGRNPSLAEIQAADAEEAQAANVHAPTKPEQTSSNGFFDKGPMTGGPYWVGGKIADAGSTLMNWMDNDK